MKRRVPINQLGVIGIVRDAQADTLALNAWSDGRNVRMRDGSVHKFLGHFSFSGPTITAPYWLLPNKQEDAFYWIYAGLTKVGVWNGAQHFNLTRQTAGADVNYTGTPDDRWTGGNLGGIPILNNGVDLPQMWNPISTGQRLQALSNWPSTYTCGCMRPFRQFLVAGNINKAGNLFSTMLKWSHPAAAGSVPASWDETDTSKDAGEYELKETHGGIIDMVPLREANVIYKTDAIWGMQYIGGTNIFRFYPISKAQGIISRNCAVEVLPGTHAVFGMDDIFVHNGQTPEGLLDDKMRQFIFSNVDPTYYQRCFVGHNPRFSEVFFAFPETGATACTLACVWNYKRNTTTIRELPVANHMEVGEITIPEASDIWDANENLWTANERVWDDDTFKMTKNRVAIASTGFLSLDVLDYTNQFSGENMTAYVERKGIGFPTKENGPPDYSRRKEVTRLWPRIAGTAGGVVNVYLAAHENVNDTISWGTAKTFTIGTSEAIDVHVSGRMHAIKFESDTDIEWNLSGYDVEVRHIGNH
jgi:hypothetical protein